jgi:GNAT superfamily N-acetyltransferase
MTETSSTQDPRAASGDDDLTAQAALFDRCFDRTDGGTVLPWRYSNGPHGAALTTVIEAEGGLAASYACGPRTVVQRGQDPVTVGQTGDVMTDPNHRGKGLFSGLDETTVARAKEAGWPCVFGLPNRASAKIFTEKLGWDEVGEIRPWTFVLVSDAGAREERLKVSRGAAMGVPWVAWRGTMARGRLRKEFFGKINVVPIARFKPEADEVSAEVSKEFPWFIQRDHAYLNWRFVDAPSGRFRAHGVYEPGGSMRGWCVVQLPERGETAGYIADIVAADDIAFAGALEAGLGHLRKAGASVARAHAIVGSSWERQLKSSGFRASKPDDVRPIILRTLDAAHPLIAAAKNPSSWFFTDADRDAELIG